MNGSKDPEFSAAGRQVVCFAGGGVLDGALCPLTALKSRLGIDICDVITLRLQP